MWPEGRNGDRRLISLGIERVLYVDPRKQSAPILPR
jgi:hypothetical protein